MTKPNITKGKWKVSEKHPLTVECWKKDWGYTIASADNSSLPDVELAENMKAIAALPELLAALEAMHKEFGNPNRQLDPDLSTDKPRILAVEALTKAGYAF